MKGAAPKLKQAREWHSFLDKALAGYKRTRSEPEMKLAEDVWNAITQRSDPQTEAGKAVALTMDPEDVYYLMGCDGIPAAFALTHFLETLPTQVPSDPFELRQLARAAWQRFAVDREQADQYAAGFGCGDGPAWMTLKSVGEFHDAEFVGQLANLAGKMYEAMKGKVKVLRPSKAEYEVAGVTTGGELPKLLPHELLKLGHPVTADLAAIRILQKQAEQLHMRGWEFGNRGPLVICVDESGSMEDRYYREQGEPIGRNTWAKACAVAMTRVAHEQRRMVRVVHFSSATKVDELPIGDHGAVLQMARTFLDGGTDIPLAMKRGIAQVGDLEKHGHRGADVVFITDGDSYDHDEMRAQCDVMAERGIALWTVGIQIYMGEFTERGTGKKCIHPLRERSEMFVRVDGLNEQAVEGLEVACLDNEARQRYLAKYGAPKHTNAA